MDNVKNIDSVNGLVNSTDNSSEQPIESIDQKISKLKFSPTVAIVIGSISLISIGFLYSCRHLHTRRATVAAETTAAAAATAIEKTDQVIEGVAQASNVVIEVAESTVAENITQ